MLQKSSIDVCSMKGDKTSKQIPDHLCVISLKRTPKRLEEFYRRNKNALQQWKVHVLDGIDGKQHKELFEKSRLISRNVLNGWSPGAIGSALSHMLSWRLCLKLDKPILVAEDDAILATKLDCSLHTLLHERGDQPPFLLLGWNFDSLLQAELEEGLGIISLFEPAYPNESELKKIVNSPTQRKLCKLKRCFGLPLYLITPETAQTLLNQLNPLTAEVISMGRGIPEHYSETLDGLLNNQYEKIGAEIVFPPLAIAINDQKDSLTRKRNVRLDFG